MSGGHLLCADRSGTKTHCGGAEDVAEATRRRQRIRQAGFFYEMQVQGGNENERKRSNSVSSGG